MPASDAQFPEHPDRIFRLMQVLTLFASGSVSAVSLLGTRNSNGSTRSLTTLANPMRM